MPEKVRLIDDPVLRTPCSEVNDGDLVFIDGLLSDMFATMKAEGGMGLAANQIGISARVFILKEGEGFKEYINPRVLSSSELVPFEGEGCLSIPGVSAVTKRHKQLKLAWIDKSGAKHDGDFKDVEAFAIQHEMDHLNGILYVDQFGPLKRDLILSKHRKFLKER